MSGWYGVAFLVLAVGIVITLMFGFAAGLFWGLMALGVMAGAAMLLAPRHTWPPDDWEGACLARVDAMHCQCWYDGLRCCACGDGGVNPMQPIVDLTDAGYPPGSMTFAWLKLSMAFGDLRRAFGEVVGVRG